MNDPGLLRMYFDYVDPLSLLLSHRLREYEETGAIRVEPWPMEVNPPPHPLLHPEVQPWASRWDQALKESQTVGLQLQRPWIVPWSRKAHELGFCAREENSFPRIHLSLFRAYLIDGSDIGRVDVLMDLARKSGMDPMHTKAVLDVDRHRNDVEEARAQGIRQGVESIPSLLWRGTVLAGYPTAEELDDFLTDCA